MAGTILIMDKLEKHHSREQAMAALNLKNPLHCMAVGFGSGYAPKAPGTFGTAAAAICYVILMMNAWNTSVYLWFLLITFVIGCWCCQVATKAIGVQDHGAIVWDEFVGFWITMLAAPAGFWWVLAGFCLFRVFDIIKPWPIRWFDRYVKGGIGIMIDDVVAGIFALVIMQLLKWILN